VLSFLGYGIPTAPVGFIGSDESIPWLASTMVLHRLSLPHFH
jgi:hypothetical protein